MEKRIITREEASGKPLHQPLQAPPSVWFLPWDHFLMWPNQVPLKETLLPPQSHSREWLDGRCPLLSNQRKPYDVA